MVRTDYGQPGSVSSPAGPHSGPSGHGPPPTFRRRIRRHRVAPYLLLLPSLALIGALVLWPTAQIGTLSFQNYGLPQLAGAAPSTWIGFSNYSQILHDPEFWLSLRLSVISAAIMVPLTLI